MSRISLKIVGAAGQGIDSIGEVVAKGLKRAGYCVFGYREFMSVIKGGHSSYQIDIAPERIRSSETQVNVLVCLNHHGLETNIPDLKTGGVIVHLTPDWKFPTEMQKIITSRKLTVICLPVEDVLKKLQAKPILGNTILSAFLWALLGQRADALKGLLREQFGHKKDLLELNMRCVDEGYGLRVTGYGNSQLATRNSQPSTIQLPTPNPEWRNCMLLTGSKAMGLGVVHAGVRLYTGYPMTPSSPLLTYIGDIQNETGMVVKQAEDEITAAQMMSGAMYMGTRAMTGTSGGGFDLMSETVSMNGIIENPSVFLLAQRPGPATGLPTWTGQGDLLLAVGTAHGEFARCVIAVSDAQDSFDLMPEVFNIAEEFQTAVIVMTDKQIAEALFTEPVFDQSKTTIRRGKLVTDSKELKKLKSTDRYDPNAKDGISPRWLPGAKAATYCAQGDEHNAEGSVDESASNAIAQMDKRMKKMAALKKVLPEPEVYEVVNGKWKVENNENEKFDLLIVGWGSTKGPVLDAIEKGTEGTEGKKLNKLRIGYLHYTYLWPLKTERLEKLAAKAKKTVVIEGNFQSQLSMLLRQECGFEPTAKILKYDGRPFFTDELLADVQRLSS